MPSPIAESGGDTAARRQRSPADPGRQPHRNSKEAATGLQKEERRRSPLRQRGVSLLQEDEGPSTSSPREAVPAASFAPRQRVVQVASTAMADQRRLSPPSETQPTRVIVATVESVPSSDEDSLAISEVNSDDDELVDMQGPGQPLARDPSREQVAPVDPLYSQANVRPAPGEDSGSSDTGDSLDIEPVAGMPRLRQAPQAAARPQPTARLQPASRPQPAVASPPREASPSPSPPPPPPPGPSSLPSTASPPPVPSRRRRTEPVISGDMGGGHSDDSSMGSAEGADASLGSNSLFLVADPADESINASVLAPVSTGRSAAELLAESDVATAFTRLVQACAQQALSRVLDVCRHGIHLEDQNIQARTDEVVQLARTPGQEERLIAQPMDYLAAAVLQVMRMYPVPLLSEPFLRQQLGENPPREIQHLLQSLPDAAAAFVEGCIRFWADVAVAAVDDSDVGIDSTVGLNATGASMTNMSASTQRKRLGFLSRRRGARGRADANASVMSTQSGRSVRSTRSGKSTSSAQENSAGVRGFKLGVATAILASTASPSLLGIPLSFDVESMFVEQRNLGRNQRYAVEAELLATLGDDGLQHTYDQDQDADPEETRLAKRDRVADMLLMRPALHLLRAVVASSNTAATGETPTDGIVTLFAAEGGTAMLDLVATCARVEIAGSYDESTLLRANTECVRILRAVARAVCPTYFLSLIGPLLEAIETRPYELRFKRAPVGSKAHRQMQRTVAGLVQSTLNTLFASLPSAPPLLVHMMWCLRRETAIRFPNAENTVVAAVFFLRLLCPLLISPSVCSLRSRYHGPQQAGPFEHVFRRCFNLSLQFLSLPCVSAHRPPILFTTPHPYFLYPTLDL